MIDADIDVLARRLKALILGGIDMTDVVGSADYLLALHADAHTYGADVPWRAGRTLETGMFVTYARPFTKSRGLKKLERAPQLSSDLADLHREIVDLRNTVYAHSDNSPFRQVRRSADLDDMWRWPEDLARLVRDRDLSFESEIREQWFAPTEPALRALRQLAGANRAHFAVQIDDLTQRLRQYSDESTHESPSNA